MILNNNNHYVQKNNNYLKKCTNTCKIPLQYTKHRSSKRSKSQSFRHVSCQVNGNDQGINEEPGTQINARKDLAVARLLLRLFGELSSVFVGFLFGVILGCFCWGSGSGCLSKVAWFLYVLYVFVAFEVSRVFQNLPKAF